MKKCIKCGIEKSFDNYYKRKNGSLDGHRNDCKECLSNDHKKHYRENSEAIRKRTKDYYYADSDRAKSQRLKRDFGISIDTYKTILSSQNGCCAICKTPKCASGKNMAVDHNHATGEIRGLLCAFCNVALGRFQDNPSIIKNAYQYLIEKGHYGPEATSSP